MVLRRGDLMNSLNSKRARCYSSRKGRLPKSDTTMNRNMMIRLFWQQAKATIANNISRDLHYKGMMTLVNSPKYLSPSNQSW